MLKSKIYFILLTILVFTGAAQSLAQTVPPAGSEAKLIAVLKSDATHKAKVGACRQLAIIGTKDAVPTLAALLADEKLSHMARYGLEPIPDPAVDKALLDALGKLKGRLLVGVIGSIGVRRDAKAVRPLTKMLQAPDAEVAQAAARALGSIGRPAGAMALRRALTNAPAANRLALCEGLFRCAEALVANGKRDDAIAIYDQLRKLDAPRQVRAGGLRGAILARQKDGLPLLQQHLRSDDYILFSAAVQTAQEMPGAEVTKVLIGELKQLPADNQILVIQTLGNRGDAAASPALFAAARSGAKSVRIAAIRSLSEIGHASAVPVLVKLLGDSDREITKAAQEGLAALPGRKVDAAVMRMLNSSDTSRQLTALELIGRRRIVASIPALLKVAGGGDAKVRPAALKKVGELGSPAELPALLDLLMRLKESQDLNAAEQALSAVCAKADNPQSFTEKFTRLLTKAQPGQNGVLLRLLGVVGGTNALKAVRTATKDSNAEVRVAAIRVLCAWETADAAPDLLALAKTSPNQSRKTAALRGYIRLVRDKNLSTEKKLAMCKEAASLVHRNEEKKLLLGVLGEVPAAEALSMAMTHLDNPATKNEASFAAVAISEKIVQQKPGEVTDALQKVIRATNNKDVLRRARATLDRAKKTAGR